MNQDTILQAIRQDQNIEYLAANLEAGAARAGWEGVEPTAERLSWWHHIGAVRMRDDKTLERQIAASLDEEFRVWASEVLEKQKSARAYWTLASAIMPEAVELLR
jgi:hypothetical protein